MRVRQKVQLRRNSAFLAIVKKEREHVFTTVEHRAPKADIGVRSTTKPAYLAEINVLHVVEKRYDDYDDADERS